MSNTSTKLKGISQHIGHDKLSNILETNLKVHYDWELLQIGGWTDVSIPTPGVYGGDFSRLRPVDHPHYTDGQVWEGIRKDWVWESGVNYIDTSGNPQNPVSVGVPQIDSNPATGTYSVNYPNGQIIFDEPVSITSKVQVEHAYRNIQMHRGSEASWWEEFQYHSFRTESDQFLQFSSGDWSIANHRRVQMPSVVIESIPVGRAKGYQVGSHSLDVQRVVLFYILAENKNDRNNIMDILSLQTDKSIWLFDTNSLVASGDYPLNYKGELVGDKNYPDFISEESGHRWAIARMENSISSHIDQIHPNLYSAVVETDFSIIL